MYVWQIDISVAIELEKAMNNKEWLTNAGQNL